ncbi:MAG: phospholipid carrier-dependent glycosyltransferase, partial [Nitrospinaceae bacterium]|nr:phospholipid carrier-dependent glycosyltransferase [Nitrospinaceae bacterium]NIR55177.1 phospholipid carrier-dependent glycosyltransferase [Nitrospinaceae bacterium]NIS85601.1 phospholipid carrier-dependent glycosyltransferase [Nitrospinaceae bacterium]NIT82447.1 phospholipid carrier-dependent glycosyltransferase [Nitrospinaceae bacterium]NIU44660.1 phospholipid carrier-dependent glycosyltransferase [Nitrospinaceae bacterium]
GYLGAFAKNYWPWLPFAVAGLWIFGRKAFREREERSLLVVLWIVIPLAVLSVSRAQYFRYMLPVFPALALLVSQTLSGWLRKDWKDKMLPWLAGSIMITVLVINATPVEFRQTATLHQNSPAVRALAPVIRLNTPEVLLNFRLPDWNPRNAVLFYTDRWMPNHVEEAEAVMRSLEADAGATWLTSVKSFAELTARFPGRLYLIQAQGPYAYFTSARFRDRVRYDFSGKNEPGVR